MILFQCFTTRAKIMRMKKVGIILVFHYGLMFMVIRLDACSNYMLKFGVVLDCE